MKFGLKIAVLSVALAGLANADPPTTTTKPMGGTSTYDIVPAQINGHAPNFTVAPTVLGVPIGGLSFTGGVNGDVVTASGATTIQDGGILLSNLQTKTGVLALVNFSSITGAIAEINVTNLSTDLAGKQPLDSDLTAIAALSTTSFGRGFLTLADGAASRTYIGAGTSSFSGLFTALDFTAGNLTSIPTRLFSDLQGIPSVSNAVFVSQVNGSDSGTGALLSPVKTLAEGKSAASSGQTVWVLDGTFNERDLLKNGVNWHFATGTTVNYTGSAASGSVFDDSSTGANGAVTSIISGWGTFKCAPASGSSGGNGVLFITNASSNITMSADYIYGDNIIANYAWPLALKNGTISVRCRRLEVKGNAINQGSAIYWENGQAYIESDEIVTGSTAASTITAAGLAPMVGQLYVKAKYISNTAGTVLHSGGETTQRVWIEALQITAPTLTDGAGGFFYITAEKNTGKISATGSVATSLYVTLQKTASLTNQELVLISGSNKYIELNIGQFDDTNLSAKAAVSITGASNSVHLIGSDIARTTTGDAVAVSNSTLFARNVNISGVTSGKDFNQTGGTVYVLATKYNASNVTGTVTQGDPSVLTVANNLSDLANAGTARTNLGLAIGTNVQAWDTDLDSWAAITRASGFDTWAASATEANFKSLQSGLAWLDTAQSFTANQTISGASLILSGNYSSSAWTTSGLRIKGVAGTLTDTSSSGTVAAAYTDKLGGNTIAASSATTFTEYASLKLSDPIAGTNVTFTNKYALDADSAILGTTSQFSTSGTSTLINLSASPSSFKITHGAGGVNLFEATRSGGGVDTIAFFNATAVAQQTGNAVTALVNYGLVTSATWPDASVTFTDVTTGNASTSNHGFLKKLDNTATHFMDGTGNWSTPAGATIPSTSNILKGDGAGNASSAGFTMPSSYTIGDLVYASASGVLSSLADAAINNVLLSGGAGAAPSYGKVTTAYTTGIAASGSNTDLTSLALTLASTNKITDSGTNTTVVPWTISHDSSGTSAASLGVALDFDLSSTTTADRAAARIAALWTTATDASRTSDLVFYTVSSAAALAETARSKANGQFVVPQGTSSSTPTYTFSGATSTGFWYYAGNATSIVTAVGGSNSLGLLNARASLGQGGVFGFTASTDPTDTLDTSISRKSAGITRFGTSSANSLGSWEATNGTLLGTLAVTGAVTQTAKTTTYNNIATVSNGVPSEVATIDSTGLTANVAASTLYAVPASGAGLYRVSAYLVTTTAASVSSTMPNAQVVYTDSDSNTSVTLDVSPILGAAGLGQSGTLGANAVGTVFSGTVVVYIKASTTIQYQTVNYSSTTAGMAYALRMKLEAL